MEGINKNGDKEIGYHIRMKGIPNSTILYECEKQGYLTPYDLYIDLYNGEKISFDLTNGRSKVNFKFNSDYSINSVCNFTRSLQF